MISTQDLAFYLMIMFSIAMFFLWLKAKSRTSGGIQKIKLPIGGTTIKGDNLGKILNELTSEPVIKETITLEQQFVDRFDKIGEIKDDIATNLKKVSRDSDDLWEEIRKFYKIGDYNLSLSDGNKTIKVKEPSAIEKTLSSFMKR